MFSIAQCDTPEWITRSIPNTVQFLNPGAACSTEKNIYSTCLTINCCIRTLQQIPSRQNRTTGKSQGCLSFVDIPRTLSILNAAPPYSQRLMWRVRNCDSRLAQCQLIRERGDMPGWKANPIRSKLPSVCAHPCVRPPSWHVRMKNQNRI